MKTKLKYVQGYDAYLSKNKINESVIVSDDIFQVKSTVEIPKSLINKIAKKIKDETGKDAKENWSDSDIAESIVAYITKTFCNEESIPVSAITGINSEVDEFGNPINDMSDDDYLSADSSTPSQDGQMGNQMPKLSNQAPQMGGQQGMGTQTQTQTSQQGGQQLPPITYGGQQ